MPSKVQPRHPCSQAKCPVPELKDAPSPVSQSSGAAQRSADVGELGLSTPSPLASLQMTNLPVCGSCCPNAPSKGLSAASSFAVNRRASPYVQSAASNSPYRFLCLLLCFYKYFLPHSNKRIVPVHHTCHNHPAHTTVH